MDRSRAQAARGVDLSAHGPLVPRSRTPEPEFVEAAKRYTQTDDRRGFNAWRRKWVLIAVCGTAFGLGVPAIAIVIDGSSLPASSTSTP